MTDIVIIGIIAVILGLAVFYIRHQKKKGVKCVGCPHSKTCSGGCESCRK